VVLVGIVVVVGTLVAYFQNIVVGMGLVGNIVVVVDIGFVGLSLSSSFVELFVVFVVVEVLQSIDLVQVGLFFEVSLMILFRLT
jgi:hypothetical protein